MHLVVGTVPAIVDNMTTSLRTRSTWISSVLYKSCPDGASYCAFLLKTESGDDPVALLYGPDVPSWVPGLVTAGHAGRPVSPGRVYNKLVKGKFSYQRIEGRDKVNQLKEMMR